MKETLHESVVCPSCGCLCDDIHVVVEENRVKTVGNVCEWGLSKFLFTKKFTETVKRGRIEKPMVRGKNLVEADFETAISKAVDILQGSKKPLVYGLTNSGYTAQKRALQIAERLQGWFEPRGAALYSRYYSAMGRAGFYIAPLEEIKNNADLIIYWGCNPIHSAPRHLARYSVYPKGRCKEKGSMDRVVYSVDVAKNEMSELPHQFIQVDPGADCLVMETIKKLLKGESSEEYTGDIIPLKNLVKQIGRSSYGVIFFGLGLLRRGGAERNMTSLMALVKELNLQTRFFLLPLYDDCNTSGAIQMLLRETGNPMPADFSKGKGFQGRKASAFEDLKEIDAALVVGEDIFWSMPSEKTDILKKIPIILIDPFWTRTTNKSQVVFPTAVMGVESEGIAYRMDGLPLHLKKVLESDYPSDESILDQIYQRLHSR